MKEPQFLTAPLSHTNDKYSFDEYQIWALG